MSEKQIRLRLRVDLVDRLLQLDSSARSALVERALASQPERIPIGASLSPCELEALDVAIAMFRKGSAGGGVVGFRAEQEYLHQYADLAEDLVCLRAKLGGVT
jgi:hypothetical protein